MEESSSQKNFVDLLVMIVVHKYNESTQPYTIPRWETKFENLKHT